jgi:hypothetical protein
MTKILISNVVEKAGSYEDCIEYIVARPSKDGSKFTVETVLEYPRLPMNEFTTIDMGSCTRAGAIKIINIFNDIFSEPIGRSCARPPRLLPRCISRFEHIR